VPVPVPVPVPVSVSVSLPVSVSVSVSVSLPVDCGWLLQWNSGLVRAKSPRRTARKAAREPDRSVLGVREDRKRSANEPGC